MNSINLNVQNGYWNLNDKPLKNCSIAKKNFFAQFVKMRLVKTGIAERRTFKHKADEVKAKYNYKFANLRQEKPIINISNKELIFGPKK